MPNYPWERPTMDNFIRNAERKFSTLFNMSMEDIAKGIQSACEFFGLEYPDMVYNLSNQPKGGTMVYNMDTSTDADDILCYDLHQLMSLGLNTRDSFTLIMTHECAHRFFQGYNFPGLNNGQWEQELACDFFMGARSIIEQLDVRRVAEGLGRTSGADTHPDGDLRYQAIMEGQNAVIHLIENGMPLTLQNILACFENYRQVVEPTIFAREQKYLKK